MKIPFCFLAMIALVNGNAHAAVIGVDAAHAWGADDVLTAGSDFDIFRSVFTQMGHTFVPLTSFNATDLNGLDAVIVRSAYAQNTHSTFSSTEATALRSFARNNAVFFSDTSAFRDSSLFSDPTILFGDNQLLMQNIISFIVSNHGVAFFADSGDVARIANFNSVVAPYGVQFDLFAHEGSGSPTINEFLPHFLTTGIDEIGVTYYLPMTLSAPAVDLTGGERRFNVLAVVPEPATLGLLLVGILAINTRRKI